MRCERREVGRTAAARGRWRARALALALGAAAGAALAEAAPARLAHAQSDEMARAGAAFGRGREAFDRGEYDAALREFRAAIELVPSPNTRLYIARSLRGLGRNAEAYAEFTRTASEADTRAVREPRYAPTAAAARADARAMLPRVAIVNVLVSDAPPDAVVRLNGAAIDRAQWNADLPFEPGQVQVDAEAPGRAPFHSAPSLPAGMVTRIEVRLAVTSTGDAPLIVTPEPPAGQGPAPVTPPRATPPVFTPRASTPPPLTYVPATPPRRPASPLVPVGGVALALGIGAGIGGVVAGVMAQSLYDDLARRCGGAPCPADTPNLAEDVARGRNRVLLTNVLIASGTVLAAVGAVLVVAGRAAENSAAANPPPPQPGGWVGRATRRHARPARPGATLHLEPVLDPLRGLAGVQGAF